MVPQFLLSRHRVGITSNISGERGVVINVASVAAFEGQQGQVAYSASKGMLPLLSSACPSSVLPVHCRLSR